LQSFAKGTYYAEVALRFIATAVAWPIILLNYRFKVDIHTIQMTISSCIVGRNLRLVLLLLLLASQGIANAHEQSVGHSLDSHLCSVCLIGHGLGAAIGANPDVPHIPTARAPNLIQPVAAVLISHNNYYLTRAPPTSL
jgi:hypothetical protein